MKFIPFFLLVSLELMSCTSKNKTAQDTTLESVPKPILNPEDYDNIGFMCGEGGEETALVDEFTNFIKDHNYKQLRTRLYSSKPGIVYLSTVSCQKLAEEGLIVLNVRELRQIEKNKNKTDSIHTCSGCLDSGYLTIKQALRNTDNELKIKAEGWIKGILIQ